MALLLDKPRILTKLHEEALRQGITNSVATCTLLIELGHKLCFPLGSKKNVKLTSVEDLEIFEALLNAQKAEWIK